MVTSETTPLGAIAVLASWAEPWRDTFSHSAVLSTAVLFVHLAALLVAGGFSLVADYEAIRAPLSAATSPAPRRLAMRGMIVLLASGAALFLSDVDAFAHLATFWIKMGLVAILVVNARFALRVDATTVGTGTRRRFHAAASAALWLCTLGAGTALMNG